MSRPDLPICARFLKGENCARSDVILVAEGEEHYGFKCKTCGSFRVISKPKGRERAAYEARIARQRARQVEVPRRIYFT
jgi:cytochrome c5